MLHLVDNEAALIDHAELLSAQRFPAVPTELPFSSLRRTRTHARAPLSVVWIPARQDISEWMGEQMDPQQVQSLFSIPLIGHILKYTDLAQNVDTLPVKAPTAKPKGSANKHIDSIRNPFR